MTDSLIQVTVLTTVKGEDFMSTWATQVSSILSKFTYKKFRAICKSVVFFFLYPSSSRPSFRRTSGENIGDSGLIQAFRAWKTQYQESKESGHEYLLPGLNFTRRVRRKLLMKSYTQRPRLTNVGNNYSSFHLGGYGRERWSLLLQSVFWESTPRITLLTTSDLQIQRIRTDPHSPTRFRVDGTLRNIPEFAEAFKCSKTAKVR